MKLLAARSGLNDADADSHQQAQRLRHAMGQRRKQHQWGDLTDEEYRRERREIERRLADLEPEAGPVDAYDQDRAAELLQDLGRLWDHPV